MSILFIDTATSGMWRFREGISNPDQPQMVRLAYLLTDEDGKAIQEACLLTKLLPGGDIEAGAAQFHGITPELLAERGVTPHGAMDQIAPALNEAQLIVAFNWKFHGMVLDRTFLLCNMHERVWPDSFCCMTKGREYVGIERKAPGGGFLFPSWLQACQKVLGEDAGMRCTIPSADPVRDGLGRVRIVQALYREILNNEAR